MQVVWYNPKRVIVGTYYVKNSEYSSFYHTSQGKVQNLANLTFFQLKYIHKKKIPDHPPENPHRTGFFRENQKYLHRPHRTIRAAPTRARLVDFYKM